MSLIGAQIFFSHPKMSSDSLFLNPQIAASHVSAGLKCTSNIIKEEQTFTDMLGQPMKVECGINPVNQQEQRKIIDACGEAHEFVDNQSDQMAANGVVHVIRDPVIPMSREYSKCSPFLPFYLG